MPVANKLYSTEMRSTSFGHVVRLNRALNRQVFLIPTAFCIERQNPRTDQILSQEGQHFVSSCDKLERSCVINKICPNSELQTSKRSCTKLIVVAKQALLL